MSTEQPEPNLRPELITLLFETADDMADSPSPFVDAVSTYLRREAHLAMARTADFFQIGLPEETAVALAQDDMAFQIAVHVARGWTTPNHPS